jgi:hypothetical protein
MSKHNDSLVFIVVGRLRLGELVIPCPQSIVLCRAGSPKLCYEVRGFRA